MPGLDTIGADMTVGDMPAADREPAGEADAARLERRSGQAHQTGEIDQIGQTGQTGQTGPAGAGRRWSTRLFRSELWLIFGRRRNWVGLAVLCSVPIAINVATKVSAPTGGGPDFFVNIASNGLFAALASLVLELPLFLPVAIAAISADAIAGEANLGTLRYLLAVPAGRTRLLAVKFAAIVVFALVATLLVAVVAAVLGLILFGGGPLTTLSGTAVSFGSGAVRVLLVCLYVTVMLTALGAVGLFVSTLTEQPIGATIAILVLALGSEIADAIPQLHAIHPYLLTHYWLSFGDLLRDPIALDRTVPGLLSAVAYIAIFVSTAWARFTGRDVAS
jgi:ABC-2 type transport system permease protein